MAVEEEDNTWVSELETALAQECSSSTVYGICQGQSVPEDLRAEVWKACLGVKEYHKHITFDEIFDLPEQNVLREDCQKFVDKLGNDDEDKVSVLCDLESVLTFHRRSLGPNAHYTRGNGWVELLLPIIALKLPRDQTCALFQAVASKYVPFNNNAFHLLRLLLLYHDPQLCSFLDTKRITPEKFATAWFQSLFAATCNLPVVVVMWDLYFQKDDCFFLLFLALVMIINAREQILSMSDEAKDHIIEVLSNFPCGLEADDVDDFCSLAQYYSNKTPQSFRQDLEKCVFNQRDAECEEETRSNIAQALCLPVSVSELIENTTLAELPEDSPRFFLVDCRPAEQYNAGHLATAFHLDCNLMLQEPAGFATAVQGLLSFQSVAGGEHLCFLGCGRLDDDQYTHMVVASFLQKHTQYVSLLTGGYQAIHDYLGDRVGSTLVDHNQSKCFECGVLPRSLDQSSTTSSSSNDLFGKIGAAMKLKSAEVKGKLLEYIVNPSGGGGGGGGGTTPTNERHVSANDKVGKRYRNMAPVFSIDDDQDTPEIEMENHVFEDMTTLETVSLSAWLKKPDVVASFKCQEVNLSGYVYESHLLVTPSHVYVLRCTQKKDTAKVVVRRPLTDIATITCKKKQPDLITFKYGSQQGNGLVISDMDRFMIPQAAQATKIISEQILKKHQEIKDSTST